MVAAVAWCSLGVDEQSPHNSAPKHPVRLSFLRNPAPIVAESGEEKVFLREREMES